MLHTEWNEKKISFNMGVSLAMFCGLCTSLKLIVCCIITCGITVHPRLKRLAIWIALCRPWTKQIDWKNGFTVYKNKGSIGAAFLLPESIMCIGQICKKVYCMNCSSISYVRMYSIFTYCTPFYIMFIKWMLKKVKSIDLLIDNSDYVCLCCLSFPLLRYVWL